MVEDSVDIVLEVLHVLGLWPNEPTADGLVGLVLDRLLGSTAGEDIAVVFLEFDAAGDATEALGHVDAGIGRNTAHLGDVNAGVGIGLAERGSIQAAPEGESA